MLIVCDCKVEKKKKQVWLDWKGYQEKDSSLYKENGCRLQVCNDISEQTTKHLEQCPLEAQAQSGKVSL